MAVTQTNGNGYALYNAPTIETVRDPNSFMMGYLAGAKVREIRLELLREMRRETQLELAGKFNYMAASDGHVLVIGNSYIRMR